MVCRPWHHRYRYRLRLCNLKLKKQYPCSNLTVCIPGSDICLVTGEGGGADARIAPQTKQVLAVCDTGHAHFGQRKEEKEAKVGKDII